MDSYLIESIDSLSLQEKQKEIIKNNSFEDYPITTYDLELVELQNALEDLDTYNFLSEKKIIIIKNIDKIKYEDNKKDFDHLIKYINSPNPDNLLIIEANKLNNTTKIAKELKKICKYIEIKLDGETFIKNKLKGYKIDNNTIKLLKDKCLDDITKIEQECNKLINYKYEEKIINKEDIDLLVVKKIGDPKDLTFSFTRKIGERDIKSSLEKYRELLEYNIEPLSIIGLLASQIRIIYQVKILSKDRLTDQEIAEKLETKPFRITKTKELTRYYSEEDLLKLMQELSKIDLRIKSEDIDPNSLIEMFILNL